MDETTVAAVAAVAAVIALPLALAQWSAARAEARSAETDLLREMRADWLGLKPQWHKAVLTAIGPDSYYSPADMETRTRFRDLMKEAPNDRDRSHEFEQAERDVLFFLATLASAVFRGRLSPDLAYAVVGPDVARRSRQVRVLLGDAEPDWYGGECPWTYWVDSLPGLRDRIFGLLDVLWAEACRRYDIETHDLVRAAVLKHTTGSGARNRVRIRRLAREHGLGLTGLRLERRLLAAEFLRAGPPRQITNLDVVPTEVQGWGLRGTCRKLWAFLKARPYVPMAVISVGIDRDDFMAEADLRGIAQRVGVTPRGDSPAEPDV